MVDLSSRVHAGPPGAARRRPRLVDCAPVSRPRGRRDCRRRHVAGGGRCGIVGRWPRFAGWRPGNRWRLPGAARQVDRLAPCSRRHDLTGGANAIHACRPVRRAAVGRVEGRRWAVATGWRGFRGPQAVHRGRVGAARWTFRRVGRTSRPRPAHAASGGYRSTWHREFSGRGRADKRARSGWHCRHSRPPRAGFDRRACLDRADLAGGDGALPGPANGARPGGNRSGRSDRLPWPRLAHPRPRRRRAWGRPLY